MDIFKPFEYWTFPFRDPHCDQWIHTWVLPHQKVKVTDGAYVIGGTIQLAEI